MFKMLNNSTLQNFISRGIIDLNDIRFSTEEDLQVKILQNVHNYKITQTNDGRWTTRVPDLTKTNGTKMIRRKSKQDLLDYLIKFYNIQPEKQINITFEELFLDWIKYKRTFVGAKTKPLSEATIRRFERDYDRLFKETSLSKMNVKDIDSIILETALINVINTDSNEKHESMYQRCFTNVWGYLEGIYEYAVRKGYVEKSPLFFIGKGDLLRFCTPNPNKIDADRVLTISELNALKGAVRGHEQNHPLYMPDYAIELAILTGMRVGEIAALKWSSIKDGYINIDFSEHRLDYSDRPSELVIGEPKNKKHRKIPVTLEIEELLNRIKKLNLGGDFVFTRENGNRYTGHDISCAIDRRASEAGIKKTSIHGIRRTVSSILNTIIPRATVACLLGHLETTNERFYDYDVTDRETKINALEQMSQKVTHFSRPSRESKSTRTA